MEPVDVLGRVDRVHHTVGVDPFRQRQLHEDPIDAWVEVERLDQREDLRLTGAHRQVVREGLDAGLERGLALVAHVNAGGRIFADLHHRKSRAATEARREGRGALGNL